MSLGSRQPFRLLGEVPQLGFVLIAAILLGDLAVVGQRVNTHSSDGSQTAEPAPVVSPSAGSAEQDIFGSADTGPSAGVTVPDYVARRTAEFTRRVAMERSKPATAVVSFTKSQTPAQVVSLLKDYTVTSVLVRVYIRSQITGAGVLKTPGPLASSLSAGLTTLQSNLASDAAANLSQGRTVTHLEIKNNLDQQQAFYAEAAIENQEIAVLKRGGPSIYAAVVSGSYGQLAALQGSSVRLIDPADDGIPAASVVPHGLTPDDTKTVQSLETLEGLGTP